MYLLFGGDFEDQVGGLYNYRGRFATLEEAKAEADRLVACDDDEWVHIGLLGRSSAYIVCEKNRRKTEWVEVDPAGPVSPPGGEPTGPG